MLHLPLLIIAVDCIDHTYNSPEELDGENRYDCSKCKKKVPAVKQYLVSALPSQVRRLSCLALHLCAQYLILHMVRTEFDPRTARPVKNTTHISFPLRGLDMSACLPVR